MNLRAVAVTDAGEWNALVVGFKHHSALQGWGWGEVKRVSAWIPHRLRLERNGKTFACVQVLRRRFGPAAMLYAPRGPNINDIQDLDDAGLAIRRWAGTRDLNLKIEPPIPMAEDASIPPRLGEYSKVDATQPEHTVLLDLRKSEKELLAAMHHMARRNLKQSEKLGVVAGEETNFEDFWNLFHETNTRSRLMAHPRSYYERVFKECNANGERAAIITARLDGKALASGLILGMGQELIYLYGGSTRLERDEGKRDPKGSNAFYWGMTRWGKQQGYTRLDLFGIPRVLSETKHAYGVYQFKERLGGNNVWFPAYQWNFSPLSGALGAAMRVRKSVLNYQMRGELQDVG